MNYLPYEICIGTSEIWVRHDRTCETASITNQFEQEELEIDQTSNMTNSKKL